MRLASGWSGWNAAACRLLGADLDSSCNRFRLQGVSLRPLAVSKDKRERSTGTASMQAQC